MLLRPFRLDIIGMIIGGGADGPDRLVAARAPSGRLLLERFQAACALHSSGKPVAGKGELAGIAAIRTLIDDAADRLGIVGILGAVENDLGDRQLAQFRFGAGLEIDGAGEAIFLGNLARAARR